MFKRLTLAAVAAAALVAMPVASEAGHSRAHRAPVKAHAARPACALTAMLNRVHAPRAHRPSLLAGLFHRDRAAHPRRARK
jgi:hypothetical protein